MKTSKIIVQGALLALGMYLYTELAGGSLRLWQDVAMVIWIPLLVALGYGLRSFLWPKAPQAWIVVSLGIVGFAGILLSLYGIITAAKIPINVDQKMIWYYFIWFWVPFSTGVALGCLLNKDIPNKMLRQPTISP